MLQASLVFVLFQLSEFTLYFRYRGLAVRKLDLVNHFFLSFVRFVFVLCHSFSNGYGVAVSQAARIVRLCWGCRLYHFFLEGMVRRPLTRLVFRFLGQAKFSYLCTQVVPMSEV